MATQKQETQTLTKRQLILAERLKRAKDVGPQRLSRPLEFGEVDSRRKCGCAQYDECLEEMAIVGCRSWTCPGSCPWLTVKPCGGELAWRTDEPTYALDPTKSWAGEE